MSELSIEERVMSFFDDHNITGVALDTELISNNYINSLFALEIVIFIENEFHIKLKKNDIIPENFNTIRAIVETVNKYI